MFVLDVITILSGIITIITGGATIIGYLQPKSTPLLQTDVKPNTQYPQPYQLPGQAAQNLGNNAIPRQKRGLSYPKIAMVALVGQILSFAALFSFGYLGAEYNPNYTVTAREAILVTVSLLLSLTGLVCAATALGMSLSKTIHLHRWGWFTSLVIGFICLLILFLPALIPLCFGIFGPKNQKTVRTQ